MKDFLKHRLPLATLLGIVAALAFVPLLDSFLILGNASPDIFPTFIDENLYQAHVQNIGEGYLNDSNPYFFEHRFDPPLVIFGGAWLNALPLFVGLSFNATLIFNFVFWSILFAALFYWLFRECRVPLWVAVVGTVLQYLQFYPHMWRSANLQPVLPFYILFSIAFVRLIREQNRTNIYLLAAATGISFYLYAYLWQTIVITLGLLFLYALVRKNWSLMKATLLSSCIGGVIGLPVPLYMLWLSHTSPYFWESISRFGLVHTHLPMAEVVYSGGWIGVTLIFLGILYARAQTLREDSALMRTGLFLVISGLGLWIMQGSNLFTGKLLETGEHIRVFIFPWLAFVTVLLGAHLWKRRTELGRGVQILSFVFIAVCAVVSVRYAYASFSPFFKVQANQDFWQTEQLYAKPLAWLDKEERDPVVIWNEPHSPFATLLPICTKHFVLFATPAMWQLVSDKEFRERYLVSQYFNDPTATSLKNDRWTYLGRQDAFHNAKTIERGIKICRILFFWNAQKDCGAPPTAIELLGETFFSDLEQKFKTDIKPNIQAYLKKYHVSYIIKDTVLDVPYHPEKLGAVRVYSDERFEIYHLP